MTTPAFRVGLIALALLSLVDLVGPFMTDGKTPPMYIAVIGAVLGAASLVLALSAWRGRAGAAIPLVGIRVLSALTAVPAFFVSDAPVGVQVFAGVLIVLTVIGSLLVLAGVRSPARPVPA